jgi:hypothetical protein
MSMKLYGEASRVELADSCVSYTGQGEVWKAGRQVANASALRSASTGRDGTCLSKIPSVGELSAVGCFV